MMEIGILVGALLLAVFWVVCIASLYRDNGSTAQSRSEVVRLNEYKGAIDAMYNRAEREMQEVVENFRGRQER